MKSILDPTFRYTPSAHTDLRKTFARVRREMRKQENAPLTDGNVTTVCFPRQRRTAS
jgi:hypothetical protein